MSSENLAAWQPGPKANLEIKAAPRYAPEAGEILIKNHAVSIQPFDARIRAEAYVNVPYPFILGNTVAGTVEAIGPDVTTVNVGDRVVSDTPTYAHKETTKWGGWQQYVVSKATTTAEIGDADFDQAVALPFALQTAVAALHLYLGMEKPGEALAKKGERVLIWGAGGSVGGYAVQYAKSVGYSVVATASPRGFEHLRKLGASEVFDYRSQEAISQLKSLGPFKYAMTTSGDGASQLALAEILQPEGGKFASTLGGAVDLPSNVERIYEFFAQATQKPQFKGFADWWYLEYLPKVIKENLVEPTSVEKRVGGLAAIQRAADDVVAGVARKKLVLNPQEP
ncbi:MAG: hypothetical protein M1813_004321 [Trichoglossum hirsutum]|nr:MAG: hypothetical protein M1813_004321 [Trichoglossum hirsutum]